MSPVYIVLSMTLLQVVASEPTTRIKTKDNTFQIANFKIHKDHKLSSETPLKNISVKGILDCMMECTANALCISTNVNTTRNDQGLFDCMFLDFDKYENNTNLTTVKGVDHYTLPSKCDENPCKLNGKCIPVYVTYDRYYCKCLPGTKGTTCQIEDFKNCAQGFTAGYKNSGVYLINNPIARNIPQLQVYCDMATSGGAGWTVFQKRQDGSVDFYRNWANYTKGFGNKNGEYWLGLDAIHAMTSQVDCILRIDLEDFAGNTRYAEYDTFLVADEADNYRLTVGGYSGNADDSLTDGHNNMQFSTKDRDNDATTNTHCAQWILGAWWYATCHISNLNGLYLNGKNELYGKGINWETWKGYYYSLKRAEMKIRPKNV